MKNSPQKGDKKVWIFFLLNSDFAMLSAEPKHIDFDGFILRTYVRATRSVAINFYIFTFSLLIWHCSVSGIGIIIIFATSILFNLYVSYFACMTACIALFDFDPQWPYLYAVVNFKFVIANNIWKIPKLKLFACTLNQTICFCIEADMTNKDCLLEVDWRVKTTSY